MNILTILECHIHFITSKTLWYLGLCDLCLYVAYNFLLNRMKTFQAKRNLREMTNLRYEKLNIFGSRFQLQAVLIYLQRFYIDNTT